MSNRHPPSSPAGPPDQDAAAEGLRNRLIARVLRAAHEPLIVFDPALRCVFITDAAAAMVGSVPPKLEGSPLDEVVPADLAAVWREDVQSVLAGKGPIEAELTARLGGGPRFIHYVAGPVPSDGSSPELALFEFRDVTTRRSAEADAKAMHRRLQTLSEASRTLAGASEDLAALMHEIVALVAGAIGDTCIVSLLTEDATQVAHVAARHQDPEAQAALDHVIATAPPTTANGYTKQVVETGEPVLIPKLDLEAYRAGLKPEQAAMFERFPFYSMVIVPLDIGGRRRGVITAVRHDQRGYSTADLALLQDLVERAGLAAGRAALFESERRARKAAEAAAEREARLQAFTSALARCSDEESVLRVGLQGALRAATADAGAVSALTADGSRAVLMLAEGVPQSVADAIRDVSMDGSRPMGRAMQERRPLYLESLEALRAAMPELGAAHDDITTESVAALPLLSGDRVLGVLGLGFQERHTFAQDQRDLLEALALQCATALERVRLIATDRQRLEHRLFLAEAGEFFASTLDEAQILQNLARRAVPRIADWCGIDVARPEGEIVQAAVAHVDPERVEFARAYRRKYPPDPKQRGAVSDVIRSGQPLIFPYVPDAALVATATSPEHLADMRALGVHSMMVVPLKAGGRTLGALTLVWSESRRRYGNEDLHFATELGERAAQAVQNARLYRDLQAAVEARDEFLAMAGHELKTPLTALLLQLQSAKGLPAWDPQNPVAVRVVKAARSAQRLEKLVSQLLDVSRITGGRLTLDPEPGDFIEIVEEAVGRMGESAQALGSPLDLDAKGPIDGLWDRMRVDQVITNLLSNALKYGHGKPIYVEARPEEGGALLRVRDLGIGIAAEQQARIFERFERAVAARAYGGLGLGLWIARQIVESAGGWIRVESAPGQGATFTVWLPKHGPPPPPPIPA